MDGECFLLVVARPNDWEPDNWDDNPSWGIVRFADGPAECTEIWEIARGFNEREMKNPKGLWAVVSVYDVPIDTSVKIHNHYSLN